MNDLQVSLDHLKTGALSSDDIQILRRALANGEIHLTDDDHIGLGDLDSGGCAPPRADPPAAIRVPEEVLRELRMARPGMPLQLPPRPLHFRGREREMARLLQELKPGRIVALTGPAGVGKSALAAEALWRLSYRGLTPPGDFPGGLVYYNFEGQPQAEQALEHIARAYGRPPAPTASEAARKALSRRCALLLLDAVDAADDLQAVLAVIGSGAALLTSRDAGQQGAHGQQLEPLDLETAGALLADWAGSQVRDAGLARQIAEMLGGMPLALRLAGAYLAAYREGPQDYLAWLRATPLASAGLLPQTIPLSHAFPEQRARQSAALALEHSLARLGGVARKALAVIARLDVAPVPRALIAAALEMEERQAAPALIGLVTCGLLIRRGASYQLTHELVRAYAEQKLPLSKRALHALAKYASQTNQNRTPGCFRVLLPHVRTMARRLERGDPELAAWLFNELGYHLQASGDLGRARLAYERALRLRWEVLGDAHPDTATSLNNLGALLVRMGDLQAAWPYYERALEIRKAALGTRHPDTAASYNNLGALWDHMGEYDTARRYYARALTIFREVQGETHPNTAACLNNLGYLLQSMGRLKEARPYYQRALHIRAAALGEAHPDTAASHHNLGCLLLALGEYPAARRHQQRALEIRLASLGERHPDAAASLNSLGFLSRAEGDFAAAKQLYQRALDIRLRALGTAHPDTATSLHNLGALLITMGDYAAARPHIELALDIRQQALGERHPDTAASLNQLGSLFAAIGNLDSAGDCYQKSLEIRLESLGERHPDTAASYNDLGALLRLAGKLPAAEEHYRRALKISEATLGERHAFTAICRNNLGLLLQARGDLVGARACLETALQVCAAALGEAHPTTHEIRRNLDSLPSPTDH